MIVYLDTSSLIKLYVREEGTSEIQALVAAAELVATSVIAYPEARSALARLRRAGGLTTTEFRLDSVHLASYLSLAAQSPAEVRFSSFDEKLNSAARAEARGRES